MHRPFVLLGLGVVIGIYVASKWKAPLLIGSVGLLLLYSSWCYIREKSHWRLLFCLLGVMFGLLRYGYAEWKNQSALDSVLRTNQEQYLNVQGIVDSSPLIDGEQLSFDFKVKQIITGVPSKADLIPEETIRVIIFLKSKTEALKAGSLVRGASLQGLFHFDKPTSLRNPGGFDYAQYLYYQSIHWIATTDDWQEIKIVRPTGFQPRYWLDQWRLHWAKQIERSYEEPYAGFLRGMLLGERAAVDPDLESQFTILGLSHLLSISGLHVGVLVTGIYVLLTALGVTREKTAGLILWLLPAYVCLTGAGAPVIRAALMSALVLIALIFRLTKDVLSFLAVALLIQLAYNPYQLFLAGFQLTYLITAALVIGVVPLAAKFRLVKGWLSQSMAVAVIAQLVSFPLVLYHFSEYSVLSFFANLLLVPLVSLSIPLAMGGIWVGMVSDKWEWLIAKLVTSLLGAALQVGEWLFSLSWAHLTWAKPSLLWVYFFSIALLYVWVAWIGDLFYRFYHRLVASSCLLLLIGSAFVAPLWASSTQITFLDVGQGDAAVIETKGGQVIVIDGGNKRLEFGEEWRQRRKPIDMGERVLIPFLKSRGIRQIDTWILTHGDQDHIGGVMAVVKRFPVKRVIRNVHPPKEGLEEELFQFFRRQGVAVDQARYGFASRIEEGIYWQFLHPDGQRKLGTRERGNEDSVVCLLSIEGQRVLFTGDIGQMAEERILADWELPSIEILKVAHHGSGSATTKGWLERLQPRDAVISVGMRNRYGHPHSAVLDRLRDHQVRIWRTDQHGAITITFASGQYRVRSMIVP